MRHLNRLVVVAALGFATLVVGPNNAARAESPDRFAIEGTINNLNPSLINRAVNVPGTGFAVGSTTSNSRNLDQRIAVYGRVAVRVTPATTFRVYRDGAYENTTYDKAVTLGTQVWAYGYMAPLPTNVGVDEPVATQVILGPPPTTLHLEAVIAPTTDATSVGPDLTGQRVKWEADCDIFDSNQYNTLVIDDGAGNTIRGQSITGCYTSEPFSELNLIPLGLQEVSFSGGTGRFSGMTGTGSLQALLYGPDGLLTVDLSSVG